MKHVTAVCGFPRCGSSLVMRLIQAAGVPLYYDHEHSFETDKLQLLPDDWQWMEACVGKAVKILDPHRWTPPPIYNYRAIWLDRHAGEQAKSQVKMMRLVGGIKTATAHVNRLSRSLINDRERALGVVRRMVRDPSRDLLMLNFEDLIELPLYACSRLCAWLGLSVERAHAIVGLIDKRKADCLSHLRELAYIQAVATPAVGAAARAEGRGR